MAQAPQLLSTRGAAGLAIGLGVAALGLGVWWYRRRLAARTVPARLRKCSDGVLSGFLIPNADTGQIHVEHAVLTRKGIILVDVRDVAGHVFGSEPMTEWTVLGRQQRFTFANPLPALYDRVAAVKRLVPEVPVRGVVAFTGRAEFSKGFPPNVVMLEALYGELGEASGSSDGPNPEQLQAAWARLREAAGRAD